MKRIMSHCKVIAALLIFVFLFSVVHSATITSNATGGVWTTGSTWVGGVVPSTGDAVIIATSGANTVQITGSLTQTAAGSVTVNTGAILTTSVGTGTITLGSLTIESDGEAIMYRRLIVLGATNISGTINFGSTNTTVWNMTFTGAVTLNSGASWNETTTGAAATLSFGSNFTNNASIFTAQNTTHTFTGASMTISGSTAITLPQATFSGTYTNSGTLIIATATFTGNFVNNGTITCATLLRITGATIRLTNNALIIATTAISGNGGIINNATGLLNIEGISSITSLANAGTTNISGPGAITTALANFANTGVLNLTGSGAITGITNNAGGKINLSSSGTISRLNNATATSTINISALTVPVITTLTATIAGNTVNYSGIGDQTIKDVSYGGNLIFSGSGTKTWTLTANRTVGGILSVESGVILSATGNFTLGVTALSGAGGLTNAATLNLGGTSSISTLTNTKTINISGSGAITTALANFTNTGTVNISGSGPITGITNNSGGIVNHSGSSIITSFINATSTSTLNISTTPTVPAFTALDVSVTGNTVNYSGAGAQNVIDMSYGGNLTISGSGTKTWTLSSNRTIGGTLSVGTGAILATAGNFSLGVPALSGAGRLNNAGILNLEGFSSITTLANTGTTNITGAGAITSAFANFTNTGTINLNGTGAITGITNNTGGLINLSSSGTITRLNNATATSTINISAPIVPAITTLTATAAGNTVNYTGTGQTLKVAAYHHLTLSGGAETFGAITTVGGNLTLSGTATATTGAGLTVTGNLNIGDGTTFTAAGYNLVVTGTTTVGSGASGNLTISSTLGIKRFIGLVTIASGATWNNSANSAVEFRGGITTIPAYMGGTGAHTFSNNAQALTGTFTIPSLRVTGITLTNQNSLTVGTTLVGTGGLNNAATAMLNIGGTNGTCSIATLSNAGIANISGSGAISTPIATFTNTGTLNLNGSGAITGITNNAGGIINLNSSGTITALNNATATSTLNISAATIPAITTLTATVAGNTVNYNGVSQNACKATTYSNLTLSGSGIKQFPSSPTVNGILSLEGTASITITSGTGVVTYGGAATLQYNKPAAFQATTKEWITPFLAAGGIVIRNTGAITTPGAVQIGNNTNVPLNIKSGATLSPGTNLLTLHGDFINAGTVTGGSGGVTLAGTNGSTLSGSGSTVMNNFTIAKTFGVGVTSTLGLLTTNKLTVSSGTFANNGGISLSGDFINNGNYSSSGTITFSGTASATISGGGTTDMNDMILSKTSGAGVTTTIGMLTSNNFTITSGNFTIDPLKCVTVNGALFGSIILKSTSAGTASLVTKGSVTGTDATVERYIGGVSWAWHFLSSPIAAQAISPGFISSILNTNEDFYSWSEPNQIWVNFKNTTASPTWIDVNGNTNFIPGRGYLVAYQTTGTTKVFEGTPNSGTVSFPLSMSGSGANKYYNLVGNPYPCSIDWDATSGWGRSSLYGAQKSYWVWNEAAGNYGTYIEGAFGFGTNGASNIISIGQGFMVLADNTASPLTMDDGIKSHSAQPYLKSEKIINGALKLKLSCDVNTYSDETIVMYNNVNDYGGSEKFNSMYANAPELWSVKNGIKYSVNFMSEMSIDKIVPLNVKAGVAGMYTFACNQVESFGGNLVISLEDRSAGIYTYLGSSPSYTFQVNSPGIISDRFFLHFMDVTGTANPEATRSFNMYATDGVLNIQSLQQLGGKVAVTDMLGRTVATGRIEAGTTTRINMHGNTGVYIVSILTSKGINNTKIIVK